MSGVIDEDGTQWEHCNCCGQFVNIDDLLYGTVTAEQADDMNRRAREWAAAGPNRGVGEPATAGAMYDLCSTCADATAVPNVGVTIRLD